MFPKEEQCIGWSMLLKPAREMFRKLVVQQVCWHRWCRHNWNCLLSSSCVNEMIYINDLYLYLFLFYFFLFFLYQISFSLKQKNNSGSDLSYLILIKHFFPKKDRKSSKSTKNGPNVGMNGLSRTNGYGLMQLFNIKWQYNDCLPQCCSKTRAETVRREKMRSARVRYEIGAMVVFAHLGLLSTVLARGRILALCATELRQAVLRLQIGGLTWKLPMRPFWCLSSSYQHQYQKQSTKHTHMGWRTRRISTQTSMYPL